MRRRRRVETNPLPRIIFAAAALLMLWLAVQLGWVQRWTSGLMNVQSSGYAERMADLIFDTPECAQYRTAILQHSGESAAAGVTVNAISQAYEAAKAAGCRKRL